ncbi:glycosyltransferase [Tenacibaculum sp. 190524A05c]|uniref:glycosyltransferase n=1 Tax=Tenacibaculum platacis TaxID=3137852 RepID=UPI0031FB9B81
MGNPAIIVIAFNRPNSLKRLLTSLDSADYKNREIPLIISIDHQDSDKNKEVIAISEEFKWNYGVKKVIKHSKNLGLRTHVLLCGDMVNDYDNVIILEDDLYVSPRFYSYASEALDFYKDSEEIGGISLYNHKRNFLNRIPFEIIPDSNDVFFLQIASSWGQAWSRKQWMSFRTWYENIDLKELKKLPAEVYNWPESSWLKYFIAFLISRDKYFVYPNKSLTTNFGDGGTHNLEKNLDYQVPLFYGDGLKFIDLDDSLNVYDAYFEILPSRLKKLAPYLINFDFSLDLYGRKKIEEIETEYMISSKKCKDKDLHMSFGLEIKPMILNVVEKHEGAVYFLGKKEGFSNENNFSLTNINVFNFFYSKISIIQIILLLKNRLRAKLFNK